MKNFTVVTKSGVQVTVTVEREGVYGQRTFPYVASLAETVRRAYQYGKTPAQAVEALLAALGEQPGEDLRYIDVTYGECLPSLLRRQAC